MPAIPRPQLAVYAAAAVAILLLGARYLSSSAGTGTGGAAGAAHAQASASKTSSVRVEASGNGTAVVQVAGAVRRPGVYRLRANRRVDDAVREAGGPTAKADLAGVNLAAKINDGQQVIVPVVGGDGGAARAAATAPAGAVGGAGAVPGQPLNLNTASPEQLDQLDGVGPATAQKIVAYRQAHGGFRSVTELDQVPGIGEKKLAALKDRVRV